MSVDVTLGDGEAWWARVSGSDPAMTYRMKVLQWERRFNDDGHPVLVSWLDAGARPVRADRLDRDHRTDGLRLIGYDRLTSSEIQALKENSEWIPIGPL